jgi:UDP-N-acetylmuramyl pentapeptide phosphotransferase/UDP-N-acetylglucosamine-1-phosphate transferase
MGGISILLGAALTLLMALPMTEWIRLRYFFISISLMFLIGLRDDILALSPKQKLYSQFLPVCVLVFLDNTTLTSTYGLINNQTFPYLLVWIGSVFTLIILTNAYNLIDGLDGLAGTVGIIILTFFGVWFGAVGDHSIGLIALVFAGGMMAFLFFNWQPSKIFMGDTGALTIGLLISYIAIQFINQNYHLSAEHSFKFSSSIATAVCVVIIPVFDTTRVIILRVVNGQSPFKADKNHFHHQFLKLGFSHSGSVLIIGGINLGMILLAWLLRKQNDLLILSLVLVICVIIHFVLKIAQERKVNHARKDTVN